MRHRGFSQRIKQLLTMHFCAGASTRATSRELGIAPSTVREYFGRASAAEIGWPMSADVTDESLMAQLFVKAGVRKVARFHAEPVWSTLVRELKRSGVTLLALRNGYRALQPQGYAYSGFCQLFREFERRLSPTMRLQHVAGQKGSVDYSGSRTSETEQAHMRANPIRQRLRLRFDAPSTATKISAVVTSPVSGSAIGMRFAAAIGAG